MMFSPEGPRKIPWMNNEAYNPCYDAYAEQYEATPDDLEHLEDHRQEYIISSIPAEIYEAGYGNKIP
ncbi:MAG: hypothetical protein ACOWWO_12760 [Peptococcaceae bacterium]